MLSQNLNSKQIEAVNHKNGPLLIVAGAGSGKTKTLTALLSNLISNGTESKNIIAITFTNKAANEMRARILTINFDNDDDNVSHSQSQSPFVGTFHSLGVQILKEEAKFSGRNKNFSIFDDDDSLRLLKAVIKKMEISYERYRPTIIAAKISKIKNELSSPEEYELDAKTTKIFERYEEELQKNNAFDFDDLIEKPVRIFEKNPDILKKYQKQFKYVLVDEYQDVNTSQYRLIKLIAGGHKNIFVVGDDGQSIYKFRGSDFRNFLNFEKDWPGAKIITLEQNYRSTKTILSAANSLIAKNKFQKPKKLWTNNANGEPIIVKEASDETEEAEWIAEQILTMTIDDNNVGYSYSYSPSVVVLYRTNAQSRAIEQALIERGIPYEIFGGLRFHMRKEIKDITAGLKYAFNPKDVVSKERIEKNFPKNKAFPLLERLPEARKSMSASELIEVFLTTTDYISYLKRTSTNAEERIENIKELMKLAANTNLPTFLEKMSLLQSGDKSNKSRNMKHETLPTVRLSTIHLAKGLEFDNVFVAGCVEGLLPHQMSIVNSEEIEEERRLMYVAMTRARKNLFISFYDLPSRFLGELPPELIEFSGARPLDDEERYITLD